MSNNLMNLVYGGSFEFATQPSGMFSDIGTPTAVVRDTGDRDGHGGAYAVKITSAGSGSEGIKATFSNLKASTKYTVRVRAKATAGDTARIWTTAGGTNLDEETTSATWVDLIGFFITDSTPTAVVLNIGSDTSTDIVWFDMLMCVEGQGAFSWTPYPGEVLAQVWKCQDIVPGTIGHPSTSPPDAGDYQGFVFDLFDDGTEEQVFHKWHVPKDFLVGSGSARGHFGGMVALDPDGQNEYLALGFEYFKLSPGDTFDFTTPDGGGSVNITLIDAEGNYTWHESDVGICNTTGWAHGDVILFRFFRDVDGTYTGEVDEAEDDSHTGDALIGVYHLEYMTNKIGEVS